MVDTEQRPTDVQSFNGERRWSTSRSPASSTLGRRWWIVLLGALAIGAATYVVSKAIPATYSSSSTIAVNVTGTDANDATLGANNYASQYAQLIGATPVLNAAGQTLGRDASGLSAAITGGTVGGQNLVSIRASGDSPQQAQVRAAAVTDAFIKYMDRQTLAQGRAFEKNAIAGLTPLNSDITHLSKELAQIHDQTSSHYQTVETSLTNVLTQRTTQLSTIATTAASGEPTLSVINQAGVGSETAPRPSLYALAAFIVALLIVGRAVVYFASRESVRP
ncbi:MAG TPA: hypothetical protein VME22_26480 [Solirubrobacteraceae bacterium]|nr:hypothetical protein [Solirubrobacteraceae bacterium]